MQKLKAPLFGMMTGLLLVSSGCDAQQGNDRLLGTWVVGQQTLEFKPQGQFALRQKGTEQTGTWERYGSDVLLKVGGQEMTCDVSSGFENQLMLKNSPNDPQGCKLASPYWRFDLPAEKRAASLVAFDCKTQGQKVGSIPYTPNFRIEADKTDKLTCYGKTSKSCQLVWFADLVSADNFSMLVTWGNGTGAKLDINDDGEPGKLQLLQSSSDSCRTDGGMASCTFSSYVPVGTCEKTTP